MTKLIRGKLPGIVAACLLVASLVVAGAVAPATTLAQPDPSVSIVPDTQEVAAGGTFSVDVVVDSEAFLVKTCEVTVTFDADLTATDATEYNLLGTTAETLRMLTIPNGEVSYVVTRRLGNDPAAVAGDFMTIDFDVSAVAAGTYPLTIEATVLDENSDPIAGVVLNHGEVVVPGEVPGAPSVSIDPATQMVAAGGTFSVDVVVDSEAFLVKTCEVTVTFDADLTATDATEYDLLGTTAETLRMLTIPNGEVSYVVTRRLGNDPAAVAGDFMTIDFDVSAVATGTYPLTIEATLLDENSDPIAGVVENDGQVVVTGVGAPSVSIDPATQMVAAGGTFSVDVVVDSEAFLVKTCEVTVTFDADLTATDATEYDLLGTAAETLRMLTIPNGEVIYTVTRSGGNDPAAVAGDLVTIDFDVDAAASGTYALAIEATLLDENSDPIGVVENDGEVVIGVPEPEVFEDTFVVTLAEGVTDYICTILGGATELEIKMTTAASPGPDMDLELYDGATKVIGEGGVFDSAGPATFSYEGDTFSYSGYIPSPEPGSEYIDSLGPLGQPYDLKVFAYEAGTYTVDVYYVMPGPDIDPPTIAIYAPDGTVEVPATIAVSATDLSGVAWIWFGVWPDGYTLTGTEADWYSCIIFAEAPGSEVSLEFIPTAGIIGNYYVAAWACDNFDNCTDPEIVSWSVT